MRRVAISLLLALPLAVLAPAPASARPGDATEESPDPDVVFRKGSAAYDAGKYPLAYELLSEAWALKQTHDIAGNLAQVELKLGKKREAAEHIAFALAHYPPTVAAQNDKREGMRRVLDGLRKELSVLRITVNVSGVYLMLDDGSFMGQSPVEKEVFVEPGSHVLMARLAGFLSKKVQVEAAKGGSQEVVVTMEKRVEVVAPPPVPRASGSAVAPPPLVEGGGANRAVLVTGGAAAGVALMAGVVFVVAANGKAGDARTQTQGLIGTAGPAACAQPSEACQQITGALEDWTTFRNAAVGSFIGAGALGAATVVYALMAKNAPKASVRATPVVTATGAGFVVGGAW